MNPNFTVTTEELVNPPEEFDVPVFEAPAAPDITIGQTVGTATNDILQLQQQADQQNAQADRFLQDLTSFDRQDTAGVRREANETFGVGAARDQLAQANLELTNLTNQYDNLAARAIDAQGQSQVRANASLGQIDRERAVEVKAQAAVVSALQENYDMAVTAANQAVSDYQADRLAELDQLDRQYEIAYRNADDATKQLLDRQKEERDFERQIMEETRNQIRLAVGSGEATPDEIRQLTSPSVPDEEKSALAQQIQSRAAENALAREQAESQALVGQRNAAAAASWALQNERLGGGETFISDDGAEVSVPTFEEYLQENAGRAYALGSLTDEQEADLRTQYDDEISVMEQTARVAALSPLAREVVNNPQAYYDFTATEKGAIFEELASVGLDTNGIISGKKKTLPATQVESLAQARNVKDDVEKLYQMLQDLPGNGPIGGRLQALDPYNEKRVAIDAQITRIVPGLARGIFNEVGVLTNEDVTRYTQTIANPNMTDEQIDLLHNDTMAKIDQSISSTVDTFNLAGYNVDQFINQPVDDGLDDDEAWAKFQEVTGQAN